MCIRDRSRKDPFDESINGCVDGSKRQNNGSIMTNLVITGIVATFDRDNIDTDQIIPTEYLKSIKKFGFGDFLFDGWRVRNFK